MPVRLKNPYPVAVAVALVATGGLLSACQDQGERSPELGQIAAPVIYGDDDRQDVYEFGNSAWADRAKLFSVALVPAESVDESDPADVQLLGDTLESAYDLCPGEAFRSQRSAAQCSGTLVAPDLVLTAGQCIDETLCQSGAVRFVFDYYLNGPSTQENIASADDVYDCSQVLSREHTANLDYALVQLDRPVTGRTPATVRVAPIPVEDGDSLYVHGHPLGVPLKLDDGGAVRDGRSAAMDYFIATTDTFSGSSGSGVFDRVTGDLVGVIARGEADFEADGNCLRAKGCLENDCAGEDATYAFRAFEYLCGNGTCDPVLENTGSCPAECGQACGDGVCNGNEDVTGAADDCEADCGTCGNGTCDPGETRTSCGGDCIGECGDNGCQADIGENTANCSQDCGSECGDGACSTDETLESCPRDCSCGDLTCDGSEGIEEDSESCCNDCGCGTGLEICIANACRSRLLVCTDPGGLDLDELTVTNPIEVSTSGDTYTGLRFTNGSCVTGNSPERIYSFTLTRDTKIAARLDSDFDSTMYIRRECSDETPENELACDNDSNPAGNGGAAIDIELPSGTYYLYVDGHDGDSGSYTLTVNFSLECEGSVDTDGDGTCDAVDVCPTDPEKADNEGLCGCNVADTNSDSDAVPDCEDLCPTDGSKTEPLLCGCGNPEGDCPTCTCEVGRGHGFGSLPAALILALLGLLAVRRPRRTWFRADSPDSSKGSEQS